MSPARRASASSRTGWIGVSSTASPYRRTPEFDVTSPDSIAVIGSVIQTMLAIAIVTVVAVLIGFRSTTGPIEWVAAGGLLVLTAVAISWLSVALGMAAKSVETASNLPMFLILLPFLSSGFVPTNSMPDGLSWFAEQQRFTPLIETVRGLLGGTAIGNSGVLAVGWCIGISVVGYVWARRLYDRNPAS